MIVSKITIQYLRGGANVSEYNFESIELSGYAPLVKTELTDLTIPEDTAETSQTIELDRPMNIGRVNMTGTISIPAVNTRQIIQVTLKGPAEWTSRIVAVKSDDVSSSETLEMNCEFKMPASPRVANKVIGRMVSLLPGPGVIAERVAAPTCLVNVDKPELVDE